MQTEAWKNSRRTFLKQLAVAVAATSTLAIARPGVLRGSGGESSRLGVVVLLGFVWTGWWLWAVLIFLFGRVYAEPLDQVTTLDAPRRMLAILALVILVLVFMPVPLIQIFGG